MDHLVGTMGRRLIGLLSIAVASACAASPPPAQDGPAPGVWFAVLVPAESSNVDGRMEIERHEGRLLLYSAPYGRTRTELGVVLTSADGTLSFPWHGPPGARCTLKSEPSEAQAAYRGSCLGVRVPTTMTLKRGAPLMGAELAASETDIKILARARQLLSSSRVWNKRDERTCEDDLASQSWSMFCALYQASIDVTGTYLHRRPVMAEARDVIIEVTDNTPFDHLLRDYNNLDTTSWTDMERLFEQTRTRLVSRVAATAPTR